MSHFKDERWRMHPFTNGTPRAVAAGMATMKKIEEQQAREMVKYELAKQIRKLLDDARKAYGPTEFDDDAIEAHVIELVADE